MMIIYKPDFSNFHEITHAISVKTSDKYGDVGKFTITLPLDDYNIENSVPNSVIYDTETKRSFIVAVRKIETNRNTITINGYSTEWLLSKRAILAPKYYPATETGIYQLIKDNLRGLPIETAEIKGLGGNGSLYVQEGQVLNAVVEMAQMSEFGIKMNFDTKVKKFTFELYKGKDLTSGLKAQIFSYERGNAQALTINEDASLMADIFVTKGTFNGVTYYGRYDTGAVLGSERVIDCGGWSMTPSSQSDIDNYKKSLQSQAERFAKDYISRKGFNIEINPAEYGKLYNLGDIVTCVSKKFGVQFNKRIESVNYQLDANGAKTKLILGNPELTKTEADKLGGY